MEEAVPRKLLVRYKRKKVLDTWRERSIRRNKNFIYLKALSGLGEVMAGF